MTSLIFSKIWSFIVSKNPVGLKGIEFVEFCSMEPTELYQLFRDFGFSRTRCSKNAEIIYFNQNDIHFLVNNKLHGHSYHFRKLHGPGISAMGLRVEDAQLALQVAVKNGAREATGEYSYRGDLVPAIFGIGDSLIYLIDQYADIDFYADLGLDLDPQQDIIPDKGFLAIDHLTNNVYRGELKKWSDFYKEIFGFTEVRYFDIKGAKTGLVSFALQSPCKTFCIPINEGNEKKSQINEYLDEYNGAGIQHLAFLTNDIVTSLKQLQSTNIKTLDMDEQYYNEVFDRVPNVTEDHEILKRYNILVDGDEKGYLLQIFTKNIIGPIFIEIIQRKNHDSFGEGNFSALFRSIERDQIKRGYI